MERATNLFEITEFDPADAGLAGRYSNLFEDCPHAFIQQSLSWCRVIQGMGSTTPIFLLCADRGQDIAGLPLYLYRHPLGNILTSVPHAGPLGGVFYREGISESQKALVYSALLNQAVKIAQKNNCLTLTLITNPFYNDIELYEKCLSPDFVLENFTQFIALSKDRQCSHGHRNNLNRAKASGCEVKFCENRQELEAWYELHQKRHSEIGAPELGRELILSLFDHVVKAGKASLLLAKHDGQIISGIFYVYHKKIIDVFMIAADSQFAELYPNFLLTDRSLQWAKELGCEIYNWQSSQSRKSGVYHFKQQWGSQEAVYYYVTKLLCRPERLLEIGIENLRKEYRGHYVVPFQAFDQSLKEKYYKKGDIN